MSRIDELKHEINSCYHAEKSAYESQENYSRAAYRSGGSEEARYKELRNEQSRIREELNARMERAGQELLSQGITWTAHPSKGVIFERG